jgi:hypothetical protein
MEQSIQEEPFRVKQLVEGPLAIAACIALGTYYSTKVLYWFKTCTCAKKILLFIFATIWLLLLNLFYHLKQEKVIIF